MSADDADHSVVRVRVDGPCGTIVLNRPSSRNALSRQLLAHLHEALGDLHQQPGVRAIVLTGASDVFSSGSDLKEIHSTLADDDPLATWFEDATQVQSLLTELLQYPKPVIAAVNGPAIGLGATLVLACDLVLAADNATFGFPESRRGLCAGLAAPLLNFRLGASHASHLLLGSHMIDAEEAFRIGLVHERTSFDLLWARSAAWAAQLAECSPVSHLMTKRVLNETVGEVLNSQLSVAAAAMATGRTTDHAREGVGAFVEKRPPKWPTG